MSRRFHTVTGSVPLPHALAAALLVVGLLGCGGGDEDLPEVAPTTGTVLYKGSSVADAVVMFHPTGGGNPATGRTNEQGQFELTTYSAGDGALPGTHTVTVQVFPEGALPGMEAEAAGPNAIPQKYADQSTSPLTAEVEAGQENEIELVLEEG